MYYTDLYKRAGLASDFSNGVHNISEATKGLSETTKNAAEAVKSIDNTVQATGNAVTSTANNVNALTNTVRNGISYLPWVGAGALGGTALGTLIGNSSGSPVVGGIVGASGGALLGGLGKYLYNRYKLGKAASLDGISRRAKFMTLLKLAEDDAPHDDTAPIIENIDNSRIGQSTSKSIQQVGDAVHNIGDKVGDTAVKVGDTAAKVGDIADKVNELLGYAPWLATGALGGSAAGAIAGHYLGGHPVLGGFVGGTSGALLGGLGKYIYNRRKA